MATTETRLRFTGHAKAELAQLPFDDAPRHGREIVGRTLYSVVSPGTELNLGYVGEQNPWDPGYAAVMRVTAVGDAVDDIEPGDIVYCMGRHSSHNRVDREGALKLPDGLAHVHAAFARLMGVSMSTLMTTTARAGDVVLVTGLGLVGNLAAQNFRAAGFDVWACEPNASRRALAHDCGLTQLVEHIDAKHPALAGRVALVVECSGHEQALLDAGAVVRKGGEISCVGAPWQARTDRLAHDMHRLVFFEYVTIRSGWEWQLPHHASDFRPHSIFDNFARAMRWLAAGDVRVDGLFELVEPAKASRVYDDLLHQRFAKLTAVFDWTV